MTQFRLYLQMIRRGWWIIALTALAALNAALALSYLDTPHYRAKARFIVSPGPSLLASKNSDVVKSIEALDKRSIIATYSEVLNSRRIRQEAIADLQMDSQMSENYQISAVVLPDASVLELTVEGPNPDVSAQLANTVGQRAINYIEGLYLIYNINWLDVAVIPSKPFNLAPERNAGVALVLGTMVGVALAISREYLRLPLDVLQRRFRIESTTLAYNRGYFRHRLRGMCSNSPSRDLTLGIIQLKDLPLIQENLSKPAFQQLLRQIGKVLRNELRGKDVLGRWDEASFGILFPDISEDVAKTSLERIQRILAAPLDVGQIREGVLLNPQIALSSRLPAESADQFIERTEARFTQHPSPSSPIVVLEQPQEMGTS